jgi:hypothetical protein
MIPFVPGTVCGPDGSSIQRLPGQAGYLHSMRVQCTEDADAVNGKWLWHAAPARMRINVAENGQQSQLVHSPAYALKTEIVPHESWTIRVRTLIAREGDRDDRP